MSKSDARIRIRAEQADWFFAKYPREALSYLIGNLMQDFKYFADDREGTLQDHIQQFHEQVNS